MRKVCTAGAVLALLMTAGRVAAADLSMPVGPATTQPVGHFGLCARIPDECRDVQGPPAPPVELDERLLELVAKVNTDVNMRIDPGTDMEIHRVKEMWSYPETRGDCEDYALLKRRMLHAEGIPLSDLLMTVVRKRDGEGHAVLTLRTASGDFVLDNLDWTVRRWTETPYRFVKRQESGRPGTWRSISEEAAVLVGALPR